MSLSKTSLLPPPSCCTVDVAPLLIRRNGDGQKMPFFSNQSTPWEEKCSDSSSFSWNDKKQVKKMLGIHYSFSLWFY